MSEQHKVLARLNKYRQAVRRSPGRADLQVNLGACLFESGDLEGAVACYKTALAIDPKSYEAYNNLGSVFGSLGDSRTALVFFQAAVSLRPDAAEVHNHIANIYFDDKQTAAAISSYKRAIAISPLSALYQNQLGNALRLEGRYAEAEACMRQALTLEPGFADAYVNLGFLFFEQQDVDHAEDYYRRAIELKPDLAVAHACLGLLLLRRGEFSAGWLEQEWRWRWKQFSSPKRNFAQPQWRGEEIAGARILLHAEQGFGDTIQMLRYVSMVAARGVRITLEVHPELKRLAACLDGVERLMERGEALPEFDWHCPLMSLPLAFATQLETIPAKVPYLRAELEAPPGFAGCGSDEMRVGIVWAGDAKSRIDAKRSLSLSMMAPLGEVQGVSYFSLQRGSGIDEADPAGLKFAGILSQAGDFAMTAAAVAQLDLVITVDTAVAHLAGALGKPVWILLPRIADWRWLVDRDDSPWYPTAKLFRQQAAADWETVVKRVAVELAEFTRHFGHDRMRQSEGAAHD